MHVVLIGDSIFDNAAYVLGAPDVVTQLRSHLSKPARATLCAVDGAVVDDVAAQLRHVPRDATHLFLSAGGNDALGHIGILDERVHSSAETLGRLAGIAEAFEASYQRLAQRILAMGLNTAICTIYYPNFPDPIEQRLATTALTVFNDVILRAAFQHHLPVLDLRSICDTPDDYANPIEPSAQGGDKIARVMAHIARTHDFTVPYCAVYGRVQ